MQRSEKGEKAMIALFVIITFLAAVALDHLIHTTAPLVHTHETA
jgi:hypothetical protein